MPFEQRPVRHLDSVEGLHVLVLEVQACGVVGEHFGVDFAAAETRPGEQAAACGDEDAPETGGADERRAEGLCGVRGNEGDGEVGVNPEGGEGGPAGEAVGGFEIVMEALADPGVGAREDNAEHNDEHIGCGRVGNSVAGGLDDQVFRRDGGVEKVPDNGGDTAAAVEAAVVEDFRELATNAEREGFWGAGEDLVDKIDEVFLAEEYRHHEVGRGCVANIGEVRVSFGTDHEDDESNEVRVEYQGEGLAIRGEEID